MRVSRPFMFSDRVRWADVDLIGIMRFSAYTRLIELAEQELMREAGLSYATIFDAPETYLPRRHLSIDYFAPVRIDDLLTLVTYVSQIGETSLTMRIDVRSDGQWTLVAAAELVLVCVTAASFSKVRLPDDLRARMAPFVCSVEEARTWAPPDVPALPDR
jgi:YbgC/YbaW family acyl-CoA thioester hydrolase